MAAHVRVLALVATTLSFWIPVASTKSTLTSAAATTPPTRSTSSSLKRDGILLRRTRPRTCFTLECLNHFQTLTLHGKNDGARLLRDVGDVDERDDWKNCAPEDRVLYTQAIALDACFRLKRRLISSDAKDPGLGTGWAYMVDLGPYMEYVRRFGDQTEMSSCSGLAALDHANTKFSRGYAATGVGMGVCARHEFVLPNAVGDLQRGERFCNMDYLFWSMLRHLLPLIWFLISYDIACQWYKNLRSRYDGLPNHLKLPVIWTLLKFVVPKMHLRGHVLLCRLFFSWLFTRGGAMGDGEGIERSWSKVGGVAASTRVSGPAALLRRRSDRTDEALEKQEAAFAEFCEKQAEDAEAWKELVHAFEEDNTQPNPYKPEEEGMTEQEVRARFEEEEAREEAKGKVPVHDVGPTEFVVVLLDVEEEQRRVHALASLKRSQATAMRINLRRRRKNLNKKIAKIRLLQAIYMPAALRLLERQNLSQETLAEKGLVVIEKELRHAQCRTGLAGLRAQLHNKFRLLSYKKGHVRHQGMATRSQTLVARNENKILLRADKYQAARRALVALAEDGDTIAWPVLRKEDIRCMDDTDDGEYAKTLRWREEKRVLVEEQQRLPLSFGFEERKWIERAGKVKVGVEDEATAEGMIAYAAKQADMWRDMARRAEITRTEPKLRRGARRRRQHVAIYSTGAGLENAMDVESAAGGDAASMGEDDGDEPEFAGEEIEEDIDEHGNASDEDDEAFIMDGDPFDD
ncbi:CxC2 domain-containing protein [Mycena kentingensis (nom. inval.)]|nr:CxC2 domain-containing protein [Mycena kentingensis (nom. inval.)]